MPFTLGKIKTCKAICQKFYHKNYFIDKIIDRKKKIA